MPKMKKGVRSPTAHRTKEQASRQWKERSPASKAKNKVWKSARRKMEKAGLVKKGDGKDVSHKKPLSKGGTNARSNLSVSAPSKNRGHGMSKPYSKRPRKKR